MATTSMTLAEKTYSTAFGMPDSPPAIEELWRTEKALAADDRSEWALTLGIAIGIARGENPFESIESVVARAVPAAAEALEGYSGSAAALIKTAIADLAVA